MPWKWVHQAGEVLGARFWSAAAASVLGQFSPREAPGPDVGLSEDAVCREVTLTEQTLEVWKFTVNSLPACQGSGFVIFCAAL